jgi:glycosyltransferase involved in cell wall biosynthesis
MSAPSISLLIPAYNEQATIEAVVGQALDVLRQCAPDHEVIVLDDASRDRTWEILQSLSAREPAVRIVRHETNQGIAATFEELYRLAAKDYVFLVSGDGQFPPEVLLRCVPLLERYDIVVCRRTYKDYTPYRHLVSFLFRWLPRVMFGVDVIDPGGVKVMRREIYSRVPVISKGVFVEAERLIGAVKAGYRLTAVDMIQMPRQGGESRGAKISTVVTAGADLVRCWLRR